MAIWEPEYDIVGQGHRRFYGTAPPTLASDVVGLTINVGDFIWNTNPSVGDVIGWVCIGAISASFPAGQWIAAESQQGIAMTLTTAQIEALFATPIVIVPALGAGTAIEVISCLMEYLYGGTAFTAGGSLALFYQNASGTLAAGPLPATFLTAPAVNQVAIMPPSLDSVASSTVVNEPIVLSNATGAFATGNGTLIVKIKFRVHTGLS